MSSLLTVEAKRRFATLMPPSGMVDQVVIALQRTVVQRLQRQIGFLGSIFLSIFAYVLTRRSFFWNEIQASSIAGWIRFAMSDPDIVFHSFKAYLSGFLEAVPYVTALVALSGLFFVILLGSLIFSLYRMTMARSLASTYFATR